MIAALPCSSFCAPPGPDSRCCDCLPFSSPRNKGTHQRTALFPSGNRAYSSVALGNFLAVRTMLLLLYAVSRGLRILIEQPEGSMAAMHPALSILFDAAVVHSCGIWHGLFFFGFSTPKRQRLYSNDPALLTRMHAAAGHLDRSVRFSGAPLCKKRKLPDGSTSWSADGSALKQSQSLGSNCCTHWLVTAHGCHSCTLQLLVVTHCATHAIVATHAA